jgi:L-iditol 2-dehydrogenase
VGPKEKSFHAGQRVAVAPNLGCGVCDTCASGSIDFCETAHAAIGVDMDGAFAEYVAIPERAVVLGNVVEMPESVSFEAGAANEALSCVYNGWERYHPEPGDTVLIIGAGAIGMMHAEMAFMSGAGKVILNDLSKDRLAYCKSLEPRLITVPGNPEQCVKDETRGKLADVVITACSVAAVQQEALFLAGLNGRVNFFGGLPAGKNSVQLDTNQIHYKELTIVGNTRSSLRQYRQTLHLIEKGVIKVDKLITHKFPVEDVKKAFDNADHQTGLKQAIVF